MGNNNWQDTGFDESYSGGPKNLSAPAIVNASTDESLANTKIPGPWGIDTSFQEGMFPPIMIDPSRYTGLYPYRLIVWDVRNNKIVGAGGDQPLDRTVTSNGSSIYRIEFKPVASQWIFSLPITPQQYSVSTVFTSNATATQRGIVEEHGGIKFKMINCAGSMGVWPNRPNLNNPPGSPTALSTLFAGTIAAASGVAEQATRTFNTATSNHPASQPTNSSPKGKDLESTGYYQMLLLDQFLEQYSQAKTLAANKDWRLVFDIPKENQSFIVTPVQFAYSKSADSPSEVKFSLQFKAWRRVDINEPSSPPTFDSMQLTPDLLSKVIATVEGCRRTLGTAFNLVKAVRSDFQTPFNILREFSLFAKDAMGLPGAVIDLPRQIVEDAKSAIKEAGKNIDQGATGLGGAISQKFEAGKIALSVQAAVKQGREGLTDNAVARGQNGKSAKVALDTDPSTPLFKNPEENFDLFNSLSVTDVNFNFSQQKKIDQDQENISNLTVDDLITKRNQLLQLALQISNAFGSGDTEYSDVYSLPPPIERLTPLGLDEYSILDSIYDVLQAIDSITATNELDQDRTLSAFEFVGSLATASGITYHDSQAKVRLPVPFGMSMEQIAARYLGDPDRWIEIATLNALRSPYIDETGFFYTLLSNADGRQFNIDSDDNLFIGQKIVLSSQTQPQNTRLITNIEKISAGNFLITVNGLANLSVFTTVDNAKMRAYLPGTVNSQDQIYVPSDMAVTETFLARPVPITEGDPLVGMSKIDWLLTESGDVAIDTYGDFRLAFGISNLIQALKMKFATPTTSLLKHPTYGAGLNVGVSNADLKNSDVIRQIIQSIQNDPRFGDIINLTIERKGPKFAISLAVSLANGNGVFPISFVLN